MPSRASLPAPWPGRDRRYAAGAEALTRREREIVALTLAGETAPAIAKSLFLSERTVESHLGRAYRSSACIQNSS